MKGLPLRLATPDLGAVGRSLLGVMVAAGAGLTWGAAGAATAAAGSAVIAGVTALQDSPRGPLAVVTATSFEMGAAVLLGTATSSSGVLFVLVAAAWCFLAGVQWGVSARAGLIATAGGALLVTAPPVAPTLGSVAGATLLAIFGGLVQAALIGLWPRRRWRMQRDALTRAYSSLGTDAANLAADHQTGVDPRPLTWLRDAVAQTDRQVRHRPVAYRAWYALPQRISVTLTALAGRAPGDAGVTEVLRAAASVLTAVAGRGRAAKQRANDGLQSVDAAAGTVDVANVTLAHRLSQQLREAVALRFGVTSTVPAATAAIGGHLTRESPILRHAVRLATAVGAGVGIERFADVPHGYWIALTALMALRPETAHTYTRCVGRIGGTAVGIVAASVVTAVVHPTGLLAAVFVVAVLLVGYATSTSGYVVQSAALTAAAVFLIDVSGGASGGSMTDRLIAVLIGGALALLVHAALPDDSMVRLRQRAGELLKTEIEYAATVVKAFVHGLDSPGEALAAAWERAFRARAAFEAAAGATLSDSGELRRWLKTYRTALNAVTTSCAALEASLPPEPSPALSGDFVVAVDEYADALCGGPTSPGAPWRIDGDRVAAAEQRIREAARQLGPDDTASRVLVAEIGDITKSLIGITD
ncbi:fusaric acid resistance protein [Mycolicibacterium madagascariense]|uniref:Fusaric acid resistance protein n=1 Tax=Mycolicibacterium madagascariense TaxID=212765 RepID=A0A7I7XHX6_9MYCO|nr:FUSC family protein [Mycolicibacterium madagascariense]MCV7016022.1 FUSC family protein [Mycolicibacterium madagascariense]BBZ28685.1 fusaric acid resistance protein [Mycolicibacterium madagascariense]